tara:strand:+ start:300 stop:1076 length:777 start_codon:yes stop_codon:yes gene_type:complete
MKIAYLMNGVIGGIKGKNYENYSESSIKESIIKHTSHTHSFLKKEDTIDYFIFSWEPELKKTYIQQYNPVEIKSIPQIKFDVPAHYSEHKDNSRIQAHYSRWYGALEVSKMCKEYSLKNNINYDLIVNARLDLCFTREIELSKFNPKKFHLAKPINIPHYNWPKNSEMIDHIFISNPEYMFKFMELFPKLNEYTAPDQCPRWKLISNHFLCVWHLEKLGLLKENIITDSLLKTFDGGYDEWSDTDYYIFRYKNIENFY